MFIKYLKGENSFPSEVMNSKVVSGVVQIKLAIGERGSDSQSFRFGPRKATVGWAVGQLNSSIIQRPGPWTVKIRAGLFSRKIESQFPFIFWWFNSYDYAFLLSDQSHSRRSDTIIIFNFIAVSFLSVSLSLYVIVLRVSNILNTILGFLILSFDLFHLDYLSFYYHFDAFIVVILALVSVNCSIKVMVYWMNLMFSYWWLGLTQKISLF